MRLISVTDTEEEEVWWKGFVAQVMLSSVQFSRSVMSDYLRLHGLQQASLSITNSWSLPKLMSIESVSIQQIMLPPITIPPFRVL